MDHAILSVRGKSEYWGRVRSFFPPLFAMERYWFFLRNAWDLNSRMRARLHVIDAFSVFGVSMEAPNAWACKARHDHGFT